MAKNFEALSKFATAQGSVVAKGDDSLFALAAEVFLSSRAGYVDNGSAMSELYVAYAKARNANATFSRPIAADAADKSVQKAASGLGTFARVGKHPLIDERYVGRVLAVVSPLEGDMSNYERVLRVNRAQEKAKTILSDEEIAGLFASEAKADKTEGERLQRLAKELEKIAKEFGTKDRHAKIGDAITAALRDVTLEIAKDVVARSTVDGPKEIPFALAPDAAGAAEAAVH